jgi:hypothetical protein
MTEKWSRAKALTIFPSNLTTKVNEGAYLTQNDSLMNQSVTLVTMCGFIENSWWLIGLYFIFFPNPFVLSKFSCLLCLYVLSS